MYFSKMVQDNEIYLGSDRSSQYSIPTGLLSRPEEQGCFWAQTHGAASATHYDEASSVIKDYSSCNLS